MRSLIIKDTQSRVYRYSLDDFLKWLNEAYRSSNGDVTITLPTPKEEKSGFVLKHPHPLGDIVVFNSARVHPYAPAFNVFSLMWAKTFFELGYSVHLLPNERTREIKEYIKKTSPCLIFGGLCEKPVDCYSVIIVHDLPLWEGGFAKHHIDELKKDAKCVLFCVDKSWCTILKEYGVKNVYFLQHYYPHELCYPMDHLPKVFNLAFVGNFARPHFDAPTSFKHVVDFHWKRKMEVFSYPFISNVYRTVSKCYPFQKWQIVTTLHNAFGFVYENFRYFVLSKLAERYEIDLWGWPWIIPNEIKNHPKIKYNGPAYWLQLPIIFSTTKINLNIHRIVYDTGTQERTFILAFCKAFFLADNKEIFRDIFPEVCKEITFNNLNELFSKVDYFLKDDSAREDISSLIYKIAIRNHTMRKRGMEILDVLKMKYNPILD